MPHRQAGLFSSQSESSPDQFAAHRCLAWWVCSHAFSKATITDFETLDTVQFIVAFGAWPRAVAERHIFRATTRGYSG